MFPQVDSIVVEIRPRECTEITDAEAQMWGTFLKVCFSGKNKTMHALLTMKAVIHKLYPHSVRRLVVVARKRNGALRY